MLTAHLNKMKRKPSVLERTQRQSKRIRLNHNKKKTRGCRKHTWNISDGFGE